ncbi:MAG: DUF1272 domain-containing protein [Litorimonas sp.]
MLEMRPNCERCDVDLPADEPGAMICSVECTWCADCNAAELKGICPNCGGMLSPRPTRVTRLLEKYPASTKRILGKAS